MRDFRLRSDLERVVVDGYAFPLGVARLDAPPPLPGYLVDYVPSEGAEPDTYAFQVAIEPRGAPGSRCRWSSSRLLPGRGGAGGGDRVGGRVSVDRRVSWRGSRSSSTTSCGPGTTSSRSCWRRSRSGSAPPRRSRILEVFLDAWKTITIHCQTDLREDVEADARDDTAWAQVSRIWLEDAFDEIDPPYRMREILVMEDEHSPDLDELLLQLRADWGLQLDVDPSSNVDDGGRELGYTRSGTRSRWPIRRSQEVRRRVHLGLGRPPGVSTKRRSWWRLRGGGWGRVDHGGDVLDRTGRARRAAGRTGRTLDPRHEVGPRCIRS